MAKQNHIDDLETHIVRHLAHLKEYFKVNEVDDQTQSIIVAVAFANSVEVLKEAIGECDALALAEAAKEPTFDAEKPVSRDFEFHGYENDDIKWKCKKCGVDMILGLDQPPILFHKCNARAG